MRHLHLSLFQELARMETQQGLEEAIADLQKRIDVLEEVLSWRMSAEEEDDLKIPRQYGFLVAKEFHNVNPFEGRILWSN